MLVPWKKSYDKPRQCTKKQRHHFPNKGLSSQSYGFSSSHVWMWELDYKESWAPKNDAFELWCWRRLLRGPWTARRSNQFILKEINPEYSLEGLMLKLNTLATWCEELTHWKRPWCWERVKAGGEGHDRGRDGWMALLTWWTWVWASSGRWWRTGRPGVLHSMGWQRAGYNWAIKQQQRAPTLFVSKHRPQASVVVQYLRSHLAGQGTPVRPLVREDPPRLGAAKPVHHNHSAWILDRSSRSPPAEPRRSEPLPACWATALDRSPPAEPRRSEPLPACWATALEPLCAMEKPPPVRSLCTNHQSEPSCSNKGPPQPRTNKSCLCSSFQASIDNWSFNNKYWT